MKFRKKPVVIDAFQWTGDREKFKAFTAKFCAYDVAEFAGDTLLISTLEGQMTAQAGDWIIRGINGEFYPCKPDIFAATYEPVEANG